MKLIVIGGGCFGTIQTGRILKAMERGAIGRATVVIVDRNSDPPARKEFGMVKDVVFAKSDWFDYLRDYFQGDGRAAGDQIIPAHIAPHLLFEVAASAIHKGTGRKVDPEPVGKVFNLLFEKEGAGSVRYISAAAWLCPFACIEPDVCPATRGPRSWDLSSLVPEVMGDSVDASIVFKTTHFAWGVGTIPCDMISSSCNSVIGMVNGADSSRIFHVAVATTSNCHGVVGRLKIQ